MKLQNFWWVLVVLAVSACVDRTGVTTVNTPHELTLTKVGNDSIHISWKFSKGSVDFDANKINVFHLGRKIEGEDDYTIIAEDIQIDSSDDQVYSYGEGHLTIRKDYSYRIKAIMDGEESSWTSETLMFKDLAFFRYAHEGLLILAPGGSEELEIQLLDADILLVDEDYTVDLSFSEAPLGCNINDDLFDTNGSLSLKSENGKVYVKLNAGNYSGVVSLTAKSTNYSSTTPISNNLADILVQVPPATVKINAAGADSANADGVFWALEVSAYVEDLNEEPVEDSVAVVFTILDNYDIVSIDENVFTGNFSVDGDSIPGYAFTSLKYFGMDTGKEVTVMAQCQDAVEIETITLPMQYPYFDLLIEPEDIVWDSGESRPKQCHITMKLMDGLNYPLRGVDLNFYSTAGESAAGVVFDGDNPEETTTSSVLGSYGMAEVSWVFTIDDLELENGAFVSSREVEIIVTIPDTDYEFTVPITLMRLR